MAEATVTRLAAGRDETVSGEFRALFDSVAPQLIGYCLTLVGDVELTHDIPQESFVRRFSKWRTVRGPRAYLYLIAINLVREHWRRAQCERRALERVAEDQQAMPAHDPWLWDLVKRLPARLRPVVLLHYYADLPVDEVAHDAVDRIAVAYRAAQDVDRRGVPPDRGLRHGPWIRGLRPGAPRRVDRVVRLITFTYER